MRPLSFTMLLLGLLMFHMPAYAEGGCPSGMIPYSGTDINSCGPIPYGYYQQQPPQTSAPPPPQWKSRWGAIALDVDMGILGSAANLPEQEQAKEAALDDCRAKGGTECGLAEWYSNGCAAMIIGEKNYNVKASSTKQDAIELGMKFCSATDANCSVYFTSCSPAVRVQ